MDAFFGQKDYSSFDAVVDPNVTLHKDLLILDQDVQGAEEVGTWQPERPRSGWAGAS